MATHSDGSTASEWRQHWTVLVPCLAGMTMAAVHGYSLGVMIGPLEREFGWSRAEIAAGPFIISIIGLFLSPLVGIGVDRFGPRRIALAGVSLYCVALASLATTSSNVLSWWVRWAFIGVAYVLISSPVWTAAVNGLFVKHRGKALAVALCGTGIAAAFVPALANFLIARQGWRQAFVSLAASVGIVVVPLVFLFFRGATDRVRSVAAAQPIPAAMLAGHTARSGLVSPAFLKLCGAALVFGITSCALTVNAVPVLMAKGFDAAFAAGIAGLIGLGSISGRLLGGILLDRFDAKKVAAVSVAAPIVFVALLLALPGSPVAGGIACFALGLSVGTEVDACAYLGARHFGMRSFGTLFGTLAGLLVFGAGVAPIVSNMIYDSTKSYDVMLLGMVPLCLLAAALFMMLGRYPDFAAKADRDAPAAGDAGQSGLSGTLLPAE